MKFQIGNKKEILEEMGDVEKQMCDIRFTLTHLPQEFEITPVNDAEKGTMKFQIGNREEILATLSEVEKKMNNIRAGLAHLPKEFEITHVADQGGKP